MTGQTSMSDVVACVSLATGIYAGSWAVLLPLIDREHLAPRWLRQAVVDAGHDLNRALATGQRVAGAAALKARLALVDVFLVIVRRLNSPKGVAR